MYGLPYRFVSLLDLHKSTCWLSVEMKERMSVSLFNAVSPRGSAGEPAGSIEVLTDATGEPHFKRADLGRYLGNVDVKATYRDAETKSRGVVWTHPLAASK